jgi:D-glycero-alpha-D-manno-heptose 1-phosphate guanylyltransferase
MNPHRNPAAASENLSGGTPVLLLVGGMGTRLRSVLAGKPKPLAPIGEITFLELLVMQLRANGFRNLVMCTGFEAGQIHEMFGDGHKWNVSISYSAENQPLGTAGAIKLAEPFLRQSPNFVVMNGDSFLELDLRRMTRYHTQHSGLATIAVRRVPDSARYGTVQVDAENRITRFSEKLGNATPGLINGGVYVLKQAVLNHIPDGPVSLEKEVLPGLVSQGIFAVEQNGMFIDIGTPEDYARAQNIYESLSRAAVSDSSGDLLTRLPH